MGTNNGRCYLYKLNLNYSNKYVILGDLTVIKTCKFEVKESNYSAKKDVYFG